MSATVCLSQHNISRPSSYPLQEQHNLSVLAEDGGESSVDAAVCRARMRALRRAKISNRAHRDLLNTSGKNEKATVVKQGHLPLLTVHSSGENTAKSSCKQRSFHSPRVTFSPAITCLPLYIIQLIGSNLGCINYKRTVLLLPTAMHFIINVF